MFFELGQLGVEAVDFAGEIGLDAVDLCVELVDALVQAGDVIFRRHVLDDVGEHLAKREALPQAEGRPSTAPPSELVTPLKTANPSSACEIQDATVIPPLVRSEAYRRTVVANTHAADLITDAIRRTVLPSLLGL
jgi:hypothetical protein